MRWFAGQDRPAARTLTFALMVSAFIAAPAMADPVSVSVRNSAPTEVLGIQVSPDYSTTWGGNRLPRSLEPGESTTIQLNEGACFYDIQVERSQGSMEQIWGVNICARPQLDLH